ncbi:hypothetical protein KY290_028891 [Solanum tuberosum]|uniref:Pectate lyase n=2 Tax=Solanum TaxID=4107 RepID=A0ABQ7UJH7_SOLTU|nr:hypothetical protein KY290_028891 [Solanum tuberosum]
MSLLEVITKASIENSPTTSDGDFSIVLNSEPALLQLKPEKEESDDISLLKRGTGWSLLSTDVEVIESGQKFFKNLKKMMKNPNTFNKEGFFEVLVSYMTGIWDIFGISVSPDKVDEGNIVKMIEKLGSFMGRDVKGLVLEACVVLETWEILESMIVNGIVDHSGISSLINNLIEKKQSWLVVLCVKHVLDIQTYDMMCVLKYFLSLSKNGDSTLINVRREWESQAMSAIEKAKDVSLGPVRMDIARDASLLLMLAHDGFSVSEMCLHYLLASRNVDEVILGACISKLTGSEIMVLIRYLQKWLNKYERFPQVCPCPKAPFELGLKACEWVPSLEDIVKCLGLVVDEHFSSLVLHQEFHEELKSLEEVVNSLTAEAKICGILSNVTEALKIKTQSIEANIGEFDEVWRTRATQANKNAKESYNPHPEKVAANLNKHVHRSEEGSNSTRRDLHKYNGPCVATNPIDRCWRCDPHWAKNRQKLADCVLGFGHHTTGGKGGKIYIVTDPGDNDMVNPKPGTLRHAVIQPGPLWIIFAHHMVIKLNQELIMTGDKTIDARGQQVHITGGASLMLQYINNVIIHGLHIHDIKSGNGGLIRDSINHYGFRTRSDGDGISIFGSTNIWIDHVSMSNCDDGLIDAVQASTAITISNCHFTHHNDVMLFGASDSYKQDAILQITLAFNHFGQGLIQRMPRVRWGFVHAVNNDYTHWIMYAIGGSQHPTILSQGNRFIAPPNPNAKEVTKRDYSPESVWKNWVWRSQGDLMMNGAFFVESGNRNHKFMTGPDMIHPRAGSDAGRLTRFSGSLNCIEGKPC